MAKAATDFNQTNLVTDDQANLVSLGYSPAFVVDPNLVNPWGISEGPGTPFWISDNGTGVTTLYQVPGPGSTPVSPFPPASPLVVTIPPTNKPLPPPPPPPPLMSAPTGQVFNGTSNGFQLSDGKPALFIFASEDGAITAWNPGLGTTAEVTKVDEGSAAAVYKGLAINNTSDILYAANFRAGTIEAYNSGFNKATSSDGVTGTFTDPTLPGGFAPFDVKVIDGQLYVTYAVQDSAKHDDVAGAGNGIVDIFDLNGDFVKRLITNGSGSVLNSPWGLQIAPAGFGSFAGDLLVGNFGDGTINAFDPTTGDFKGALDGPDGKPLFIQDLWALTVGSGSALGGDPNTVYFTAGLVGEGNGLFGALTAIPEPSTWAMMVLGFAALGLASYRRARKTPLATTTV
jgi:uncharacterized protein (TIGR03118 family)